MKKSVMNKITYEDKFDRKYACWVRNNKKAWRTYKRRVRKDYRLKMGRGLREQLAEAERESNEQD